MHENLPSLRLSGFDEVEGVIDEPGHVLGAVVVKVKPQKLETPRLRDTHTIIMRAPKHDKRFQEVIYHPPTELSAIEGKRHGAACVQRQVPMMLSIFTTDN